MQSACPVSWSLTVPRRDSLVKSRCRLSNGTPVQIGLGKICPHQVGPEEMSLPSRISPESFCSVHRLAVTGRLPADPGWSSSASARSDLRRERFNAGQARKANEGAFLSECLLSIYFTADTRRAFGAFRRHEHQVEEGGSRRRMLYLAA